MATATAFGSITIIDITDIGEFSVYPMSNLPLSVLYSPDANTYTPSWSTNNLVLTPVVYYAGSALTLGTSGLSISWQKMEGIASTTMSANEVTGSDGILTVNANLFNENSSIITYTVTATYLEPSSQTTLTAQGQISFSLVKMASEARNVVVNGNNVFKYNSNGSCDITSTTLTATVTDNLVMNDWEYSNDDGQTWTSLNNSTSSFVISEGSAIFSNDRVLIRAVAKNKRDDADLYYDYVTVVKLRDGTAAGNSLVLSNESLQIPCDSDGNPTSSAFKLANTSIYVYESGSDITSEYTITATPNGVLGAWSNSSTQIPTGSSNASDKGSYQYYCVTGWESSNASEVAEVTFSATKGSETLTKKMSLIKIKTGADGTSPTIYSLDLSDLVVNKSYVYSSTADTSGNYAITNTSYSPTSIVATASQTTGNTTSAFNGYIKVYKDGGSTAIASGTATSGKYALSGIGSTYVPNSYLTFELYSGSGDSDKLLDSQNVLITSDGAKGGLGGLGESGVDATNVILGNYSDIISVSTDYKVPSQTTITIPFCGYKGATKVSCTATSVPNLFGQKATITNATASADGSIVYKIPTTVTCGSSTSKTGTIALLFTCNGSTVTCNYTWAISVAANDGQNSIILQMSTPNGFVFLNGDGQLTIKSELINGGSVLTSNVSYQWAKYSSGNYVDISGLTAPELTVNGSDVDSYASYRCTAQYNGSSYVGYASLIDKTDPVLVFIISTIGTLILNGNGVGAFYAKVTRNGLEIDAINSSASFVTSKPSSMSAGDLYYFVDSSTKTVKLYKATSSTAWQELEETYSGTYNWYYRDVDNKSITVGTPATTGKIVYIDASLINKKISIDAEVTI